MAITRIQITKANNNEPKREKNTAAKREREREREREKKKKNTVSTPKSAE